MSDNDVVIRVENLSKRYKLGLVHHDRLADAITAGFHWAARGLGGLLARGRPGPGRGGGPRSALSAELSAPNRTRGDIWALRNVSFEVRRGDVLGIIGANGAGKTTLLKILTRITEPTEGRAWLKGRVGSLLEVGTGFHPELTGRENIFLNGAILGMTRQETRSRFDEIVEFSGIAKFIDTPVKRYSSGMYVRLAFAVAAHLEPEILLVDEVLAVGDAGFRKKCLGKMSDIAQHGRTVLFVSHNMAAIRNLCPRTMLIRDGRIARSGESQDVIEAYLRTVLEEEGRPSGLPPGFLYRCDPSTVKEDFAVTAIELLDEQCRPREPLGTWDYVRFRIHYVAKRRVERASVELRIRSREQISLLVCSTEPDSTVSCTIEPGEHYADCVFPKWPLAAGEYAVGAGLAIPRLEYIYWNDNLCKLTVVARDVFHSGLPPAESRSLFAVDHRWELPGSTAVSRAAGD